MSIGLAIDKTPVVGVVYNFVMDQMFAARKGGGATMNGAPIHVSKCTGTRETLIILTCIIMYFPEPTKAMILVDTGSTKKERLLQSKFDVTYKLAKEPNPVER